MHDSMVSPWARLNLRWNPFGEPPQNAVPELIVLPDENQFIEHLTRERSALQILGKAGRGKTARLRRLQRHFPGTSYIYLAEDEPLPAFPRIEPRQGGAPALLLDEAQRLPRGKRRRLLRQVSRTRSSLVLASHEDLSAELIAEGLTTLTIEVRGLDEHRLLEIVTRRLEWARRSAGPLPELTPRQVRKLLDEFGDDLRSLLDRLYDDYQNLLTRTDEEMQWQSVI